MGFCSFGSVVYQLCNVLLNLLNMEFLQVLYSIVFWLLYAAQLTEVLNDANAKTCALVTVYPRWNSTGIEPSICQSFSNRFNLLIQYEDSTLHSEKVSATMRMFSFPSLLGSILVKAIHGRSMGLFATIGPCYGFEPTYWPVTVLH